MLKLDVHKTQPGPPAICFEPPADAIQPRLQTCGLAADDTLTLVSRLAEGATFDELSREIATGDLLRKRSPSGRKQILAALRIRYVQAAPPLPGLPELATALRKLPAATTRNQLLLPYLLHADRVAFELATSVVVPRLTPSGRLTRRELVDSLGGLLIRHGRQPWSDSLQRRWSQGLLSVLRDVDALGRGKERELLKAYAPRLEVVCFHLWGLYAAGLRGSVLHESRFWRLLLLREGQVRPLIGALGDRGWWKLATLAGTDEILPVNSSLMEWLTVALG